MVDSCLTITVVGEPNIELISFTADCTPDACTACNTPCSVEIIITWKNNGALAGTFTPGYTIDGVLYTWDDVTLAVGESDRKSQILEFTALGDYEICASPPQ